MILLDISIQTVLQFMSSMSAGSQKTLPVFVGVVALRYQHDTAHVVPC